MDEFTLEAPDHAYMFAFLQADGHHSASDRNRGRVSVEVSARDAPILEAFQRICPHNSSIKYRTRATNFAAEHASAAWSVHALEFREQLLDLGLPIGRKSDSVTPPTVPFSTRDYVRGLVDADGSVGRTGAGLPFVSLTTKSEPIKRFFCDYAQQVTGTHRTVNRNARDDIYNILYTCEDAVALARDLYYPGALALPRKLSAAAHAAAWIRPADRPKIHQRRWTAHELDVLRACPSAEAAAAELGRTVQSCAMRRWRMFGPQRVRTRIPHARA
ncbi:LAGLIDADG family homing endonuclease [Kitasatospora terrestris]|uniref:Homing endonuclease LAGLIDADG domain-containing protein n=1 Tax=Kitasatospora terrestris TaxID=258051 RepID=A0ABP9E663_9ACTN